MHNFDKRRISALSWIRKFICLPFGLDLIYAWILLNLHFTRIIMVMNSATTKYVTDFYQTLALYRNSRLDKLLLNNVN